MTELLVSLAIITLVISLVIPLVGRTRASAQSVSCLSQLRQIAAGLLQYAGDYQHRFPDPVAVDVSWEQLLSVYVPDAAVFRCPADAELFPSIGSSYDWRDTGKPETTLAGRPLADMSRGDIVLVFDALPGWHAQRRMNAAMLSGAAMSMIDEECMANLHQPIHGGSSAPGSGGTP